MTPERRPLTAEEKQECARLKAEYAAYNAARPKHLRLTQESAGAALGMGQSAFSNYLNGARPLNKQIAAGMSKLLGIAIEKFSPRLADEITALAEADLYLHSPERGTRILELKHSVSAEKPDLSHIDALYALATPRSQQALVKIARAAQEGRLTEADLVLLELIAERFERTSTEHPEPDGSNTRLRERLRKDDPNAQQ